MSGGEKEVSPSPQPFGSLDKEGDKRELLQLPLGGLMLMVWGVAYQLFSFLFDILSGSVKISDFSQEGGCVQD